jgi:hypothetical protein
MRETSKTSEGILWRKVDLINQRGEVTQELELVSLMKRRLDSTVTEPDVATADGAERDALT